MGGRASSESAPGASSASVAAAGPDAWRRPEFPLTGDVDLAGLLGTEVERFPEAERRWIVRAYRRAEELHAGQKRLSGDPYLSHLVATTRRVLEMGLDWQTVCAALLHDAFEDTPCTYAKLKEEFPDPIADLVSGVTNISSLSIRSSREQQTENFRRMILAMARDIRVVLIKLADRMHNMETLRHLPPAKQKEIARTTMEIYAPLAGRLGIYRIKSALEDAAMGCLYPEEYEDLNRRIAQKRQDRERHIANSVAFLKEDLARHGIQAEVTGRSKHFWSIFQKMCNQGLSFEEICDLNALRVICETRNACYEILGIIHSIWRPVPGQFADYIAMPKPNMYQSIHTKVIGLDGQLAEIQVRTREMHRVAEEGIAAHWRYKEGGKTPADTEGRLLWLRQMVDWLQDANDPSEIVRELRRDAFDETIFCFTPRGDVIEMPRGATVLDFAYRIHTDLGQRCAGGKVNRRFVPLRARLRMGDLVEIQTSKTPHPSPDWLRIVTTARARSKIRHQLKQVNREKNVQLGRDMLTRALSAVGVQVSAPSLSEALEPHLAGFNLGSSQDLYAEVGFGAIPTSAVVARFLPPPAVQHPRRKTTAAAPSAKASAILVDGMPGALTRFARCCNPQPGDPIRGFVTLGRGVSIHRQDCPQLARRVRIDPADGFRSDRESRIVPVDWSEEGRKPWWVGLRIKCKDRKGILRDVTETIASMNLMIVASHSRSNMRSGSAIARFTVLIDDQTSGPPAGVLNALMNRLRDIPGVESVTRDSKTPWRPSL
jgi:GTP pyrophosphokinase